MKAIRWILVPMFLAACGGSLGVAGDTCSAEADCEEALVCDIPDGETDGSCAEASDES